MLNLTALTHAMLNSAPTAIDGAGIPSDEIYSRDTYYCIAKTGTKSTDWASKKIKAYIDATKALVVFADKEQAEKFAVFKHCVLADKPLVYGISKDDFSRVVAEYMDGGIISSVKLYSTPPIDIVVPPDGFRNGELKTSSGIMTEKNDKSAGESFKGVDTVIAALNTYEANARKKHDPGRRFENIHTLVQTLVQQNEMDYEELDNALNLPRGYTREFCISSAGTRPARSIIERYLTYFGLREYLYIFKKDSTELIQYINDQKTLDAYELTNQIKPGDERFELKKIVKGKDRGGYNVYNLTLTSSERTVDLIVSNPLNKVVGRQYAINGLASAKSMGNSVVTKIPMRSEAELQTLSKGLSEVMDEDEGKPERTYEELRKDAIIAYFKRQGMDFRSADAKYKSIEFEPDVLDEFYKYVKDKKFGKLEIAGYTARKLIREMHMEPYQAYLSLVQLRTDPQNTKQRLKYRETDPQYQKNKENTVNANK